MTFSKEWDTSFKKNKHMSIWPWSDLVSYVMRYVKPSGENFKVLELGCGNGANIPFFKHLGVKYFSIEGSITIVNRLKEKYPELNDNIICGDFTQEIPILEKFDLIIDRGALTLNLTKSIKKCLDNVLGKMKTKGKFIGIDWFSTSHSDFKKGEPIPDDPYSRKGYKEGPLADIGIVHFSDKKHLIELFDNFDIIVLEHKICKREIPNDNFVSGVWNFVSVKK